MGLLLFLIADVTVATPATRKETCIIRAAEATRFLLSDGFPRAAKQFWTPSKADVARLEKNLDKFLNSNYAHPTGYFTRQYVGVIVSGKKLIWLNAFDDESFRGDPCMPGPTVDDGGCNYWRVLFDPKSGKLSDFSCNGVG